MEIDEIENLVQGEDVDMIDASKEEAMEIQSGPKEGMVAEKASQVDELDPRIIEDESQLAPIEELENFEVDSYDSPSTCRSVKTYHWLERKLKGFLWNNLDVFAWKMKTWFE